MKVSKGFCIWLTGPSGAGKSTIAHNLLKKLKEEKIKVELLDGDEIRNKLYPNLGFSKEAREIHNKVVIEMAKRLVRNDVVVIVSLISPFKKVRDYARKEIKNFIEVYVYAPLEERIKRDPKGLYAKAIKGEIKNLTGYDGIYEEPKNPELKLDTLKLSLDEEINLVINKAKELHYLEE